MDSIINAAIGYLLEHHLSEKELTERLQTDFNGTPEQALVPRALTRLKELQVINDLRLAESIVYRFSNKGNYFIKRTLRFKVNDYFQVRIIFNKIF